MITKQIITIPENELTFLFSRSSGPGGQNVNKLNTRVTLLFDLQNSPSLTDDQKNQIRKKLHTRITKEGQLRISSQRHRSQHANRLAAIARLQDLLTDALTPKPPRRKTTTPRSATLRRLEQKKQQSQQKKQRSKTNLDS